MTLTRWHRPDWRWPADQLFSLRDEIDRLFESPLRVLAGADSTQPFMGGWCPAIDVCEDKDSICVRAEVPGMKKEDLDISLHDGVLTIAGERQAPEKEDGTEVYRSERFVGRFQRTVALSAPVDADKIKAAYADGILTVRFPKAEAAKPKQIQVK